MNSQVNVILHVASGLLTDVLRAYPALKGVSRDLERLTLCCQTRGLGLFTLDLPHLDSLLLSGFETGRLVLEGPLSRAVSSRVRVPRLFSGLWLRVFDRDACLRPDADINAIAFLRQIFRLGKNLVNDCSQQRIQSTVKEYHDVERTLRSPTYKWDLDRVDFGKDPDCCQLGDCLDTSREDDLRNLRFSFQEKEEEGTEERIPEFRRLLANIQQVADLLVGSLGLYDPVTISGEMEEQSRGTGFKHGLGAVSERIPNWSKSEFRSWPEKLQGVFPFESVGKTAGSDQVRPLNHEVPSRLLCVPKTAKGPRLIASEPTAHMYCQQHVWGWLRKKLRPYKAFVDFSNQGASGDLVLKASLDRSLATVDLSSASDRLSCWTVERMFRRNPSLLTALHAARTRYIRDDVSDVPSYLKLRKFASQGTAVTFPVQSIVFLCIALGSCIQGRVTWTRIKKLTDQVRVYGDDIIIPSHGYARLVVAMDLLQLKVNAAKSYVHGHFRESCGTDGYMGCCVTPVSPKTLVADGPASCQAVVDTTNNLYSKGYWHASDNLRSTLPLRIQRGFRIVGPHEVGFAGFTSFCGSDESHLATRWNSRLHRNEVRVLSLRAKSQTRSRQGYPGLLDFFTSPHNPWNPRIVSEYRDTRRTTLGSSWEPSNTAARVSTRGARPVLPSDGGELYSPTTAGLRNFAGSPSGLLRDCVCWACTRSLSRR